METSTRIPQGTATSISRTAADSTAADSTSTDSTPIDRIVIAAALTSPAPQPSSTLWPQLLRHWLHASGPGCGQTHPASQNLAARPVGVPMNGRPSIAAPL